VNPLGRFSSRVDDYIRYRPSYPPAVIELLAREFGLSPASTVADIGSGTGFFAKLLLYFGCTVIGIEPNPEMRAAGEQFLVAFDRFRSLDGRAEATGLDPASVDAVVAGQAFHWFEPAVARIEFQRILRPPGCVALIWNERLVPAEGFLRDYEDLLLRHAPDYSKVDHRQIDADRLDSFFGAGRWKLATFGNRQDFDWTGLRGRVLSSSYIPKDDEVLMEELEDLFDRYQKDGRISFLYETKVYYGEIE